MRRPCAGHRAEDLGVVALGLLFERVAHAQRLARGHYGRLLGALASRWRPSRSSARAEPAASVPALTTDTGGTPYDTARVGHGGSVTMRPAARPGLVAGGAASALDPRRSRRHRRHGAAHRAQPSTASRGQRRITDGEARNAQSRRSGGASAAAAMAARSPSVQHVPDRGSARTALMMTSATAASIQPDNGAEDRAASIRPLRPCIRAGNDQERRQPHRS